MLPLQLTSFPCGFSQFAAGVSRLCSLQSVSDLPTLQLFFAKAPVSDIEGAINSDAAAVMMTIANVSFLVFMSKTT